MKIALRADATSEMGVGHLRRCLALADAMLELGGTSCFVVRGDAVARHVMADSAYPVFWLPEHDAADVADDVPHAAWARTGWQRDAQETATALNAWAPDWVIVDHYAFDARWHDSVRSALECAILAIDDLGDRAIAAEILLDSNAAESHADKYAGRLKRPARMLTGPRLALLSPAYRAAPRYAFSPQVRSIGVFMGGTDKKGVSAMVIEALRRAGFGGRIEAVSSAASPRLAALADVCAADGNAMLSVDLPELSAFYARHDLHIGAGGTSSYERCCIGAPTVALVFAANQLAVVPILSKLGVVRGATLPGVDATRLLAGAPPLETVVQELLADPEQRRALSENSRQCVDGRGAERVALAMFAGTIALRPATLDDADLLHRWRNDPATRSVSINTGTIGYEEHVRWLVGVLASPSRKLSLAMVGRRPVGVIRFDALDGGAWQVSLYMDPDLHGLGLGKRMLLAGEARMLNLGEPALEIHAQVVPGNLASQKMFEGAGYRGDTGRLVKIRRAGDRA